MAKPTILLVAGAWHTADYFGPLIKLLEATNYPTVSLGLPSVGASPPVSDFSGDVAAIRTAASELIADDKEVVAVLHSYGGIAGTEALQGLGKAQEGKAGRVIALVYIATMLPKKGHSFETHVESVGDFAWKPAREALAVNGLIALPSDFATGMLYNDLEAEQAKHWTSLLKPQSVGVFLSPITHETYRDIPSGYLLTTIDQAFKYEFQLKTVEGKGFSATRTLETGHSPFLSKPDEVKQFIIQATGRFETAKDV